VNVMVTGSRGWTDHETIFDTLTRLFDRAAERAEEFVLMHGGAEGADTIAHEWGAEMFPDVEIRVFRPRKDRPSPQRFHERNDAMLYDADYVLAFWDGKSRGTKSVIDKAIKRGLEYEVHAPEGVEIT